MKTKMNFIFIIGFVFLSGLGYSQEQKFIEVMASDTVVLNATKFVYQINIGEQMEFMGMKIPSDQPTTDTLPQLSDVTKLLDMGKFNYTISDDNDYTISKNAAKPDILVDIKNEKELKKLYNAMKPMKGISGKIKEVSYEPVSKYYDMIYKKLYSDATTQASQLASVTGNSIGQLISISYVKEEPENSNTNMEYYKELMKSLKYEITDVTDVSKKKQEIKMIFKFGIK